MLFPLATIGDLQFRLLLIRPHHDSRHALEVSHRWDTLIGEGRTTIEERSPARAGLVLTQSCTLALTGTAADDWNKGLAALGLRPVGMPLWIDALPVARWSERIYDPQQIVNFDPVSGAFAIYTPGTLPGSPAHPLLAPLLLGRWQQRPPAVAPTNRYAEVELTLPEARPWSCRIGIHTHGAGWTAVPDWQGGVKAVSDYGLETTNLPGVASTEPILDRKDAAPRWRQEASFTFPSRLEIRRALTAFEARRGALDTFAVPAWFQPGADTPGTPSTYTARFASDSINLRYISGATARSNVAFLQEIDTGARSQAIAGEAYLYALTYQHDTGNPERFTSWDAPLTTGEGAFAPGQCAHKELLLSLRPQDQKAELQLAHVAGSLAADWITARLFGWVRLKIWRCDPDDAAATATPLFEGFVKNVLPDGNTLALTATLLGDLLARQIPTDDDGPGCKTYVFSRRCGLVEADYDSAGTAAAADLSSDGLTLTVHDVAGWGGTAYAEGWFAPNGILRTGAGRNRQIATVVQSVMSAGNLVVKFARPLWADKIAGGGQAVQLVPSCSGQYEAACGDKFANQVNHRAFPFKPAYLKQNSSGPLPTAKK